jgi:hypothetical protein
LALETFGAGGLGNEISQMKDAERRDKVNVCTGWDLAVKQVNLVTSVEVLGRVLFSI